MHLGPQVLKLSLVNGVGRDKPSGQTNCAYFTAAEEIAEAASPGDDFGRATANVNNGVGVTL